MVKKFDRGGRELGHLIPQDDGVDTVCYKLEIPDTYEWKFALRTLVYSLANGRYWKREAEGRRIDSVQPVGMAIFDSLMECEPTPESEIIEIEIIRIIKEIEECCCMTCCCGSNGGTGTGTPTDSDTSLPPEGAPAPEQPPSTVPVDPLYDDWNCKLAKYQPDALIEAISGSSNLLEIAEFNYGNLDDLVVAFLGGVSGVSTAYLYTRVQALVTNLLTFLTPSLSAGLINYINLRKADLIEAMYCATTAQIASDAWFQIFVTDSPLSFTQKALMVMWLRMVKFEATYQTPLERVAAPLYNHIINTYSSDCSCGGGSGGVGLPEGYILVPMLPDFFAPVNGGDLSNLGNDWQITGQGNSFADVTALEPEFDSVVIPNAARVGFVFTFELQSLVNGDGQGYRVSNPSTQISLHGFGGVAGDWLQGDQFVGVINSDATLQTWLTDNEFKQEDDDALTDTGRLVTSFGVFGGTTSAGLVNIMIVECDWIIDTSLL